MKNTLTILFLFFVGLTTRSMAQTTAVVEDNVYWKSAYEYIFSWGDVSDAVSSTDPNSPVTVNPIVRFSAFLNSQEQLHVDFSKALGMYTGIGVRNIGFINEFTQNGDVVKVKQRQYALGIPLALKIGSMSKNVYLAVGAELELFFNYKQKVFYNSTKTKGSEWFSSNSNILNPSFFAEVNFPKGQFVRFRYYLNDFLRENSKGINYGNQVLNYDFTPSSLMYISIGTALDWDKITVTSSKSNSLRASIQ